VDHGDEGGRSLYIHERAEKGLIEMARLARTGLEPTGRRGEVLRLIRGAPGPVSIAEIADRLGVHLNTVRFHLDTLIENGQVERAETVRRTPGRPPQLFRAVRVMDPNGPRHYRLLAEVLADTLDRDPDPRGRAIAAGRAWGSRHGNSSDHGDAPADREPVGRLVSLLDALGFAPEHDDDRPHAHPEGGPSQIRLRNCPFFELASSKPQIACPIHLGLMQGALNAWGSPVTVDRLDPFAEPDLCVAHLAGA
jgi:predicted ArsR family transcriptional regulator